MNSVAGRLVPSSCSGLLITCVYVVYVSTVTIHARTTPSIRLDTTRPYSHAACGMTGLAAGYAIGIVGDACVRAYLYESRVFVSMVLILIFA